MLSLRFGRVQVAEWAWANKVTIALSSTKTGFMDGIVILSARNLSHVITCKFRVIIILQKYQKRMNFEI